jgi:hypothetical protein
VAVVDVVDLFPVEFAADQVGSVSISSSTTVIFSITVWAVGADAKFAPALIGISCLHRIAQKNMYFAQDCTGIYSLNFCFLNYASAEVRGWKVKVRTTTSSGGLRFAL